MAGLKRVLIRRLLSLVGGILTLVSLAMPWTIIGGNLPVSVFQPNAFEWIAQLVPWMIIAGGLASMVSRYGGLITFIGLLSYGVFPPFYLVPAGGPAATEAFGIGFWLAWFGAGSSILGFSWNLPFPLNTLPFRKQVKNRTLEDHSQVFGSDGCQGSRNPSA